MKLKKLNRKTIEHNKGNIDLVTISSVLLGVGSLILIAYGIDENVLSAAIAGSIVFGVAYHNFCKVMFMPKEEIIEELVENDANE